MQKKSPANLLARECIVTALIQLASQKPLSAITISELTQRAGVSRMTYYRNYQSKEEIFQTYMNDIVDAYRNDIFQKKIPETFGQYENILHCFRYFEKYKEFITCLIHVGMANLLLDALCSYITETFSTPDASIRTNYTLMAYAGALFNVYIAWLKNDTREPAESLADIIYDQFGPSTHTL